MVGNLWTFFFHNQKKPFQSLSTPRCVVIFVLLTFTLSLVGHQHISTPTGTMETSLNVRTKVMTTRKSGCFVTSNDVTRGALVDI